MQIPIYLRTYTVAIFVAVALNATVSSFAMFATTPDSAQLKRNITIMEISKSGTRAITQGSKEFFTGQVQVEPLAKASEPATVSAGQVTFEPGARSAWHTHPLGQILIVTDGSGVVQSWGQPPQFIQKGDVIWTPAGVKHWHGASAICKMTHIAIQESLNGKNVEWMEHVSDNEYVAGHACCEHDNTSDFGAVSPALAKHDKETVTKLWEGDELSKRDRSIITITALIARNQPGDMARYFNLALDNGVTAGEISEVITHLAFYSGWSNASSAANVARVVFLQRNIKSDDLPQASPELLPLNKDAEETRANNVEQLFGKVAPGVVRYTTDILFHDLWLRPGLKPRDRSLVTVSALIANGQVLQVPYHLNRAMDNGLTQTQASAALTHLAFYVGWPNVFSALPVVKDVFEKRSK